MKKRLSVLLLCLMLLFIPCIQACAAAEGIEDLFGSSSLYLVRKDLGTLSSEAVWISSSADGQTLLGVQEDSLLIGNAATGEVTAVAYDEAGSVEDTYRNFSAFFSKMVHSLARSDDFATWSPDGRYIVLKSWSAALQNMQFGIDLFVIDTQTASDRKSVV